LLLGVLALGSLAPACASAANPLEGTWKADVKSVQASQKPDVLLLENGMWSCKTCVPEIDVAADGKDHAVTGHPYYDSVAIKVVDDRTVEETDKKAGKVVTTSTSTVSPDDKTLTFKFTDSSNSNAAPVTGGGTETRVGAAPAKGEHAVSGSWRLAAFNGVSDNGVIVTYKVEGDSLAMSSPTGQAYTAKMDGTNAPMTGDPGISSVSVKKVSDNEYVQTDMRDGKPVGVTTMNVAADGKSMKVTYQNKLQDTQMSYTANKQ
jgi:hypothetical protein